MVPQPEHIDAEEAYVRAILVRIRQEAQEWASELGISLLDAYDVLAVIHGQAGLGERDRFLLQGEEGAE